MSGDADSPRAKLHAGNPGCTENALRGTVSGLLCCGLFSHRGAALGQRLAGQRGLSRGLYWADRSNIRPSSKGQPLQIFWDSSEGAPRLCTQLHGVNCCQFFWEIFDGGSIRF